MVKRVGLIIASLTVALVVALPSGAAFASSLTASGSTAMEAQAPKTKTIYVVSKITLEDGSGFKAQHALTYNKDGLLAKDIYTRDDFKDIRTFAYSKSDKLKTVKSTIKRPDINAVKSQLTRTYNKKGLLTAETQLLSNKTTKYILLFKRADGKVVSYTSQMWSKNADSWKKGDPKLTGKYTYKKGRISKCSLKSEGIDAAKEYYYDSKGNIVKYRICSSLNSGNWTTMQGENAYNKSGRLISRLWSTTSSNYKTKITYKYKAIKVPVKKVALVKSQRKAILNNNVNLALDGYTRGWGFTWRAEPVPAVLVG